MAITGSLVASEQLQERVLIVEHEFLQAQNLQSALQESGFYVIGSTDKGEEAVQICADLEPTLVLMDTCLAGGMKGTEAARQIHRRFNIPVVFMTSGEDEPGTSEACKSWPYGSFQRGCRDHRLVETLKTAVDQRQQLVKGELASIRDSKAPVVRVSELACYTLFSGAIATDNGLVRLTPKEQKFLDLLGRNQGRVVPFERIFSEVWDDRINGFQPLRILVHRLRRKLGSGDGIENVFEMGYRLNILAR